MVEPAAGAAVSPVRLSMLMITIASLLGALGCRLVYLQVIDGDHYAAAATANQVRTVYEPAPRGRLLDRNGNVLVGNREVDAITVERAAAKADATLLPRLASLLAVDVDQLRRKVEDPKASPYLPAVVAQDVDKSAVASLRERQAEFPGVAAETRIQRWYPHGTLAAHLLGYVGEISDAELTKRRSDGYHLGEEIGKSGIEAQYESDLRGKPGVDKVEVDASGRAVRTLSRTAPMPGRDLRLTIDAGMQQAAEEGIAQGLDAARGSGAGLKAGGGSAVAIDPRSGAVLVLASAPSFDPASFAQGISQELYNQLTDPNGSRPLEDRAIQGQYAPGSTFKLMTAIAGLQSHQIAADTMVNDTGTFVLGDRRFRNAQGKVYGPLSMARALTVSSDVYFYNLGNQLWSARKAVGDDAIQRVARSFGFGASSGIELGGEVKGRVPDPKSRKELHAELPQVYPEGNWYPGDNVNLAIGQGDTLVTPLQLANAYATFANGGTLYRPFLVAKVEAPDGGEVRAASPAVVRSVPLDASVREPISQGLAGVVQDPAGTAWSAFRGFDSRSYPVAGKTGTAQVTGKSDSALFAGFGPTSAPQVAVAVVLEEAGFGGTSAAPVARKVFAAGAGQASGQVELGTGGD